MGRLRTLAPRLQSAPPRVTAATIAETARDRGRSWARLRVRILARDRGLCTCARCARDGALKLAAEVDHRIPLWAGGTDDPGNLGAINRDCHKRKTGAEYAMRARGHAPTDPAEWLNWAGGASG